jgi:hypothetical protein
VLVYVTLVANLIDQLAGTFSWHLVRLLYTNVYVHEIKPQSNGDESWQSWIVTRNISSSGLTN